MLPMDSTFQGLPNGKIYFVVAWKFIVFDNLILWFFLKHNPNKNQNSNYIFTNFFHLCLNSFDVVSCGGLKIDLNDFFITPLEKWNLYEFLFSGEEKMMNS